MPPTYLSQAVDPYITPLPKERIIELKRLLELAIKTHKLFYIQGTYNPIRNALLKRGWIQKMTPPLFTVTQSMPNDKNVYYTVDELKESLPMHDYHEAEHCYHARCEDFIRNKILDGHTVDFYWGIKRDGCLITSAYRNVIRNRLPETMFTTKYGLNKALGNTNWFFQEGIAEVNFPRCYNLAESAELEAFVDDFRLTACISVLKYVIENVLLRGEQYVQRIDGTIPIHTVRFAIRRCEEHVRFLQHEDIDHLEIPISNHDWSEFLKNMLLLVTKKEYLSMDMTLPLKVTYKEATRIISLLKMYISYVDIDGMNNIWILKPNTESRGRGIILTNDLSKVMSITIPKNDELRVNIVAQKYIERPLLVYQTKFDIRQWFIVTGVQPLTIWMYKECYLRFSSQKYDVINLHQAIHLTNNAIQKKYPNCEREAALPTDNMWDSYQFEDYLRAIGKEEIWRNVVYPRIKRAIVGIMLSSQDTLEDRPNSFQLFGADFMLDQDYKLWLIEVNSNPDMFYSTKVTARMCFHCLDDLIKVVIDTAESPTCDTGQFECIYKQNIPRVTAKPDLTLQINGQFFLSSPPAPVAETPEKKWSLKFKTEIPNRLAKILRDDSQFKRWELDTKANLETSTAKEEDQVKKDIEPVDKPKRPKSTQVHSKKKIGKQKVAKLIAKKKSAAKSSVIIETANKTSKKSAERLDEKKIVAAKQANNKTHHAHDALTLRKNIAIYINAKNTVDEQVKEQVSSNMEQMDSNFKKMGKSYVEKQIQSINSLYLKRSPEDIKTDNRFFFYSKGKANAQQGKVMLKHKGYSKDHDNNKNETIFKNNSGRKLVHSSLVAVNKLIPLVKMPTALPTTNVVFANARESKFKTSRHHQRTSNFDVKIKPAS